jgi:hypothetical protein
LFVHQGRGSCIDFLRKVDFPGKPAEFKAALMAALDETISLTFFPQSHLLLEHSHSSHCEIPTLGSTGLSQEVRRKI